MDTKIRMQEKDVRQRAREASARYRNTVNGKQKISQYYSDNKDKLRAYASDYGKRPEVRKKRAERQKIYRERDKDKMCARHAVTRALINRTLSKPSTCDWCGKTTKQSELQAHHWLGYDPEYWLDVKFVHSSCHPICETKSPEQW